MERILNAASLSVQFPFRFNQRLGQLPSFHKTRSTQAESEDTYEEKVVKGTSKYRRQCMFCVRRDASYMKREASVSCNQNIC